MEWNDDGRRMKDDVNVRLRWQYLLVISCMGARLRLVRNDNSRGLGMMPTHTRVH